MAPRGKPASNREWKRDRTAAKFSTIKVSQNKSSWQKRKESKQALDAVKAQIQELKDESAQVKQARRKATEEKKKRKEENEKRSQVVQVMKDSRKMKRYSAKEKKKVRVA